MRNFADITVVGVTGLQERALRTGLAIEQTARILSGSRALLVSPERPPELAETIRHRSGCAPGYDAYQRFMLFDLADHIDTDFALVVQQDGWASAAENWRDEFLDFDYVGAPGHFAQVIYPDGMRRYFRHFDWIHYLSQPDHVVNFVMNGGFSLRSQKLMRAARNCGVPFPPAMPEDKDENLEDVWLCATARAALEERGVRFAPIEAARSFSIEHAGRMHIGFPMQTIFGHHSRERRIEALSQRGGILSYKRNRSFYEDVPGEEAIFLVLQRHGWTIEWPGHTPSTGS